MTSRWIFALLFVSLAFNILIVGVGIGRHIAAPQGPGGGERPPAFPARHMLRLAPTEARPDIRAVFRQTRAGHRALMEERKAIEDEVRSLLRQTPFDQGRFTALMEDHRILNQRMVGAPADVLIAVVPMLSDEGRAQLADTIFQRRRLPQRR